MGYCPFSALGRDIIVVSDLRLRRGVPGTACRNRPPWVLCHDRELPVAIEMSRPVSQQRA